MNNITIWCSYHDDKLIDEYNLNSLDKNIYQLFNTNNLTLQGKSINYLNKYLNEYCTLYYIWKNNIKSDIVGFCHYRRIYNNIDYISLNNNKIQALEIYETPAYNIFEDINYLGLGWYVDIILMYIKENYIQYYYKAINIFFDTNVNCRKKLIRESFICKWEIFNDLMEFIYNFLEYLLNKKPEKIDIYDFNKLCLNFNEKQWNLREEFFKEKQIVNYSGDFLGYHRNIGFLTEYLIILYFLIFHKNKYFVG